MPTVRPAAGLLDDFLTEEEAAAQLGKDIRALQRWRALGEGPPVNFLGKTPYYRKETTRDWILGLARPPVRAAKA